MAQARYGCNSRPKRNIRPTEDPHGQRRSKTSARRWRPRAPAAPPCTCWMRSTWTTTARRCRLNQIAQVHAPEPQLITVQPFDPTALPAIEKAIRGADLGLNPMNDGKIIRVPVPPLTEERRKDMVKHLHKVLEDHRTAVRNIRRDGNDAIKKAMKDKKISEDEEKRAHGRDPEAHRRRNQEDGRDEQRQRERSDGDQVVARFSSVFLSDLCGQGFLMAYSYVRARG